MGFLDVVGDVTKSFVQSARNVADDVGDSFEAALEAAKNASPSTIGHTVLDGAGMAPIIGDAADLINAGWYLAEGNKLDASLSAAAAIPLIGGAATAAKWGKNAVKAADAATDVAKTADHVVDSARAAESTAVRGAATVEARGGAYVLRDAEGTVVRSGRTNDLARREAEHLRDPDLAEFQFEPAYRTDVYAEQRGLEQILHNQYSPALNKIRPISSSNPKLPTYMDAAQKYLLEHGGP